MRQAISASIFFHLDFYYYNYNNNNNYDYYYYYYSNDNYYYDDERDPAMKLFGFLVALLLAC